MIFKVFIFQLPGPLPKYCFCGVLDQVQVTLFKEDASPPKECQGQASPPRGRPERLPQTATPRSRRARAETPREAHRPDQPRAPRVEW